MDPDISEGKTPLNLACELGLVEVTRILLEAGERTHQSHSTEKACEWPVSWAMWMWCSA